jgi:hypothetical protein
MKPINPDFCNDCRDFNTSKCEMPSRFQRFVTEKALSAAKLNKSITEIIDAAHPAGPDLTGAVALQPSISSVRRAEIRLEAMELMVSACIVKHTDTNDIEIE